MTAEDIIAARDVLGVSWGLGRPLRPSELGRVLRVPDRDPGRPVLRWEAGGPIPGPAQLAIELMLDGARPRQLRALLSRA